MAGLKFSEDVWDIGSTFDTAQEVGSGSSYDTPRTSETVTSNAIQSGQDVDNSGGPWQSFFRDAAKSIVGYSIQKDAVQSGVVRQPANQYAPLYGASGQPVRQVAQQSPLQGMLPLLLLGGFALLILKR
jgi:hypothetical protein